MLPLGFCHSCWQGHWCLFECACRGTYVHNKTLQGQGEEKAIIRVCHSQRAQESRFETGFDWEVKVSAIFGKALAGSWALKRRNTFALKQQRGVLLRCNTKQYPALLLQRTVADFSIFFRCLFFRSSFRLRKQWQDRFQPYSIHILSFFSVLLVVHTVYIIRMGKLTYMYRYTVYRFRQPQRMLNSHRI